MKAPDFEYARPASLPEALALLAGRQGAAQPLAGGQSLMPMLNFRLAAPELLIDLAGLAELRGVTRTGDALRIGAMTTFRDLADRENLSRDLPMVAAALPHVAHDAIRNRGTLGGSLALGDAAAEMPAVMRALGATIELAGPSGRRSVLADDFFMGYYTTACAADELLVAIEAPVARPGERFGFHEVTQRHGDYAMAGVAIRAGSTEPLADLRIVFFGIADRPVRIPALEAALEGGDGGPDAVAAALPALEAVAIADDFRMRGATRRHLAGVALRRAMADLRL